MYIYHENASLQASFIRTGDAYAIEEKLKIAAVADSPIRELLRSKLRRYPQDDHGFEAAETFCRSVVESLSNSSSIDKQTFLASLLTANSEIKKLNESLGRTEKDYLHYDLAETVGVAAIQTGDQLIYGGLEDCYVFVLRGEQLENVAPFDYQIVKAAKYVERVTNEGKYKAELPRDLVSALPEEALWEPVWCNILRNNHEIKDENDELVGWGAFTGEERTEPFIQVHQIELQPGDHVFVLSDGMLPLLNSKVFLNWFVLNVETNFRFSLSLREKVIKILGKDNVDTHKEKTFVYWKYDQEY